MSLVAPVNSDGKVNISESSQETERKVGSSLDKDDFLMLLVTQMKYQDPLEPTSNTEYVSQLAQFSELEQMQNLNQTTTNTSAYTLVGKEVYIERSSTTGDSVSVQGTVDYVTIQNGKAKVCVNGELYDYEDIVQVIDEIYLISQYLPSVKEQSFVFLHHDPQDIVISGVDLGSNGYQASGMGIVVMAADGSRWQIPAEQMSYKDGNVTIKKEALAGITAGEYTIAFVFNDPNETIDCESVKLTIKGNVTVDNTEQEEEDSDAGQDTETTEGDNTN